MGKFIMRPPVNRVRRSKAFRLDDSLFAADGSYSAGLGSVESLLKTSGIKIEPKIVRRLGQLLVHECERSKQWQIFWDRRDDPQRAFYEWIKLSGEALRPLIAQIARIRKIDGAHPFDIRQIFRNSAEFALSPETERQGWLPDPNFELGGFDYPTGGAVARRVELNLLDRIFISGFTSWLDSLQKEIVGSHSAFKLGRVIGPMVIDPPLSDHQIQKRNGEQLAILALMARLQSLLRRVTSGKVPMNVDGICGELPTVGKPCWKTITVFVQSAFPTAPDMETLKQRWSVFSQNRTIRLDHWPDEVVRQVSLTKNENIA